MKRFIEKLEQKQFLTESEAESAAALLFADTTSPQEVISFLTALRDHGETSEVLIGFLTAIRKTTPSFSPSTEKLMDVCGTGGDCLNTFNISTGVALILGSLGIRIAKHGNRSVSSRSGSADVLEVLKIASAENIDSALHSLTQTNLSFLSAQAFFPVLRRLATIRKQIGTRTIFNVLGPLLNPAPITHQLMGVYDPSLLIKCAEVLKTRGLTSALIVHGSDGLDELTLSGETLCVKYEKGVTRSFRLAPGDFGLARVGLAAVKGGSPSENAQILLHIFQGERSPRRDLLFMNAAAALALWKGSEDYLSQMKQIELAIDSGRTLNYVTALQRTEMNSP